MISWTDTSVISQPLLTSYDLGTETTKDGENYITRNSINLRASPTDFRAIKLEAVGRGGHQWRTEGVWGVQPPTAPPEIPKALQNRAKLNPIVKTVKNYWI